jgi:hypothetical protein
MNGRKVPFDASRRWPVLAVAALNVVPVAGVVFWGWSAFALIFLYWLENLVIGLRTLASMTASAAASRETHWAPAALFAAFFAAHYGLFWFGHGVFLVLLFGGASLGGNALDLAGAARALFAQQPSLAAGLVAIALWQGLYFSLFLVRGDAARTKPLDLMGAPYPRLIILHLAIILAGFALMLLNQPLAGLIALTLLKAGFDIAEARRQDVRAPLGAPRQGAANQA